VENYCLNCEMLLVDSKYCWKCGQKVINLPNYCSNCNHIPKFPTAYTDTFCRNCGTRRQNASESTGSKSEPVQDVFI